MIIDAKALWIMAGVVAQGLFAARFIVQWRYSEVRGRSLVPHVFWYLSVAGGVILLAYAMHRREPVFIAGEAVTLLVFLRNLRLISRASDEP